LYDVPNHNVCVMICSKVWKKLTAGPVDTRPAAVHTEKVRLQYPFMAGMIAEEYFGDGVGANYSCRVLLEDNPRANFSCRVA
jgi:hypothetical protein